VADWYYIGHYGQLGPLTREQIDELIASGVIVRESYVWRTGMPQWVPAHSVGELASSFTVAQPFAAPPPPPMAPQAHEVQAPPTTYPYGTEALYSGTPSYPTYGGYGPLANYGAVPSDRSRVAAGVLQLFIPGVGRMYLGYMAYGVLQLLMTIITCGVGYLWSFVDGILILAGTPKVDGYGRVLGS
jgi:hypothetical protein